MLIWIELLFVNEPMNCKLFYSVRIQSVNLPNLQVVLQSVNDLQVLIISDPKYNTKWANDVWGFPLLSESIFWNKWAAKTGNEEKKINGDCIVSGKLENTSPNYLKTRAKHHT